MSTIGNSPLTQPDAAKPIGRFDDLTEVADTRRARCSSRLSGLHHTCGGGHECGGCVDVRHKTFRRTRGSCGSFQCRTDQLARIGFGLIGEKVSQFDFDTTIELSSCFSGVVADGRGLTFADSVKPSPRDAAP